MRRDYCRGMAAGALLLASMATIGLGAGAVHFPDGAMLGIAGRIFDSLAFHLLAVGLVLCALLALAGARQLAAVLALAALAGGGAIAMQTHRESRPLAPERAADLTVLWFNALQDNAEPPQEIADALIASDADVIIVTEAGQLSTVLPRLDAAYPYRQGCERHCQMILLSRLPPADATLHEQNRPRRARMTEIRIAPAGRKPVRLIAEHFIKPWHFGQTEADLWFLKTQLAKGPAGDPVVLMGDFNSAPWSRRLREIRGDYGLVSLRKSPATWPAAAGPLGVPIDQVLLRGDAAVTSIAPWGGDLGSNHRGLIFSLALPPA